jgi:hypothetical protein
MRPKCTWWHIRALLKKRWLPVVLCDAVHCFCRVRQVQWLLWRPLVRVDGCYVARAGCGSSECSVARSTSQSRSALRIEPQDTIPWPRASLVHQGQRCALVCLRNNRPIHLDHLYALAGYRCGTEACQDASSPIPIYPYLSAHDLHRRYRHARDPVERSRWQFLWLLARGETAASVSIPHIESELTAFAQAIGAAQASGHNASRNDKARGEISMTSMTPAERGW